MVSIDVKAGLLIRKDIRDFLEDCIFRGLDISYRENRHIFSSHFVIKGTHCDVSRVSDTLSDYYGDK
jgi:hypothetical protein